MNSLAQGLVAYYDYLVLARAQLLDRVRQAAPAVYTQSFPFGRGSIRATLLHTAWVEWAYVEALRAGTVVRDEGPFTAEALPDLDALARAWDARRPVTRQALSEISDPVRPIDWVRADLTPPERWRLTARGMGGQILFHEIHHRAGDGDAAPGRDPGGEPRLLGAHGAATAARITCPGLRAHHCPPHRGVDREICGVEGRAQVARQAAANPGSVAARAARA